MMKVDALPGADRVRFGDVTLQSGGQGNDNFTSVLNLATKKSSDIATNEPQTPQEVLAEYLRKSPGERMRDAILKRMDLTEADLAAMSPEKRAAAEESITKAIKEALLKAEGNAQYAGQALLAMVAFATDEQKTAMGQGGLPGLG